MVEGILHAARYRPMLTALAADHRGRTAVHYLGATLPETLRRHSGRPQATEFTAEDMRGWYVHRDLLGMAGEHIIDEGATAEESIRTIWSDLADAPTRRLVDSEQPDPGRRAHDADPAPPPTTGINRAPRDPRDDR